MISGWLVLPLRLFLGITFFYAGVQKLTDPGFFRLGAPTYIGTQLHNFAHNSPIQFLLTPMLEHAEIIGGLTILTELAIGTLVLLGLFTRLAALAGLVVNMVLFLSASWSTYPYFLGSDIIFVMAWLTLALTGPGALYLDGVLADRLEPALGPDLLPVLLGPVRSAADLEDEPASTEPPVLTPARPPLLTRAEALAAGAGAVVLVLLGLGPRVRLGGASSTPTNSVAAAPTAAAGAAAPSGSQKVGNISQIPVNSALATNDPKSGDPAVVVHTSGSNFYCYDATCTHNGCTVQYDSQYKLLVCPCHGGAFDPAHGAAVVAGPPPSPLTQLPITISSNGDIYLA